jgi:hypothetical protein
MADPGHEGGSRYDPWRYARAPRLTSPASRQRKIDAASVDDCPSEVDATVTRLMRAADHKTCALLHVPVWKFTHGAAATVGL